MEKQSAIYAILARNAFYRRMHFLVMGALFVAIILIGILLSFLLYLLRYPTAPVYFAADPVGRLIDVIPEDRPNMSLDDVKAWTINAIQNSLSYDFINFRAQLQNAQNYFTSYGWQTYMDALTASNNLGALQSRKMVFLANVIDQPKISTKGILWGAYAWRFEMPVLMTYLLPPFDAANTFTNPLTVTVVVQRQPILQSLNGLGIVQIIANISVGPTPQQQQIQTVSPGVPGK